MKAQKANLYRIGYSIFFPTKYRTRLNGGSGQSVISFTRSVLVLVSYTPNPSTHGQQSPLFSGLIAKPVLEIPENLLP
jgi:hypothetical protein